MTKKKLSYKELEKEYKHITKVGIMFCIGFFVLFFICIGIIVKNNSLQQQNEMLKGQIESQYNNCSKTLDNFYLSEGITSFNLTFCYHKISGMFENKYCSTDSWVKPGVQP